MTTIGKRLLPLVAVLLFGLLAGCGSNAKLVKNDTKKFPPLAEDAQVVFLYAPVTPVVPENAEYISTLETNMATQCKTEEVVPFLEKSAREQGANLVFVKKVEKRVYVQTYYVGVAVMSRSKNCEVFIVDFYANQGGSDEKN